MAQNDKVIKESKTQDARQYSLFDRFCQKLALAIIMFSIIGPFWYWPLAAFLLFLHPFTAGIMTAYLFYIFVLNKDAHMRPEGKVPIRRIQAWHYLADYFPAKLVKTCEIDPRNNYLFCGHPHGVACFSFVANFFIEATGFSKLFPGLTMFPTVLDSHFYTPFHREVALLAGFRGASKEALKSLLAGRPGTCAFLVPGGAPEALVASPGTYNVILKKRKGFIRLALQTGAHLVPIISFGETNLFDVSQPTPGSFLHKVQGIVLRFTGFAFPVISGAGFWSGSGPLPKSLPTTTVVGTPIPVTRYEGSTEDPLFKAAVEQLHARYCQELQALWNLHKDKYAKDRVSELTFVE